MPLCVPFQRICRAFPAKLYARFLFQTALTAYNFIITESTPLCQVISIMCSEFHAACALFLRKMTVTKQILPAFVFFAAERSDFPPGKYAPPTPKMRTDFSPVRIFWTAPHKACVVLSYVKDYFESDGVWSGVFCAAVRAVLSRLFRRCAALSAGLSRRHSIGLTAVHAAGAAVCQSKLLQYGFAVAAQSTECDAHISYDKK